MLREREISHKLPVSQSKRNSWIDAADTSLNVLLSGVHDLSRDLVGCNRVDGEARV